MAKRQADLYNDPVQNIFKYWNIQPGEGQCQSPTDVLLWFVAIWTVSGLWALLLGSRDVRSFMRAFMRDKLGFKISLKTEQQNFICACTGSLAFHICMTVATGVVFGGSNNILNPMLAWFNRPLPTLPVAILTFFDRNAFEQNNDELFTIDMLYSIIPIVLIGQVASLTLSFSEDQSDYSGQSFDYAQGLEVLQAGSGIGMVAWVLTMLFLMAFIAMGAKAKSLKNFFYGAKSTKFSSILVCIIFLRALGGCLLWCGATLLSPPIFCPTDYMVAVVSVIWTFIVPLVDHLWRALFSFNTDID